MRDTPTLLRSLSVLEKAALLSGANTWQTRAVERLGIPALWMADGPHGVRKQAGSADHLGLNASEQATCFPTSATIANSWDEDLAAEIGQALGREAAGHGVDVLLGPGLNIKRSPLGGRNFEYFSEDPELSGRLAAAFVRGIQSQGVAATPKHFAVNSQELRRMVSDSVIDERTMREIYLTAFEIVVREARPWALMSAYNLINGVYAHEHTHLLRTILRDEWGFDGAVVSDWGGGDDPVAAVRAGGTIEMPSPGFDSVRAIVAAVARGDLAEEALDARVAEVIELARRVSRAPGAGGDADEHHALARRAAAESAVLLRNEGALLPLAAGTGIAVIGEFATAPRIQGAGSSAVNPTRSVSLVDALREGPLTLRSHVRGYRRDGVADPALVAEAVAAARSADVAVLALGQPEAAESEGLDRSSLELPADQVALLAAVAAANPRTIVLLTAGGVITTPWLEHAAALVHGYLGGQAGPEGLADVVAGVVEPGGRLAETFPLSLADTPTRASFPSTARTAEYRESVYVGYRYYESADVPVAFGFGFGLGYTTFAYTDLVVDEQRASFTVTNTGARAGADVAQVYISRLGESTVHRPARELKGFAKVRLQPGASERVTITFTDRAFRFYDVDLGSWQIEQGEYRVQVGPNVQTLPREATLTLHGTQLSGAADPALTAYSEVRVHDIDDTAFAALLGRPVPPAGWPSGPLTPNSPMDRLAVAQSLLARGLFRLLEARRRAAERAGTPDLNVLFIVNGPFRIISKMSGGLATSDVTAAVLAAVNGRTVRGLGRAIAAFLRGRRAERRSRRAFDAAAGSTPRKGRNR